MSCRVLVADCPWQPRDTLPGPKRGAAKHYATLDTTDLCLFPLPDLARDVHLFFWRLASMVRDAIEVIDAWNFTPKAELVWIKSTKHGKRAFGMGRTVRMEHEVCIIATRGKPKVLSKSVRSTFTAPIGRHSEKPDAFFAIVEQLCGPPTPETHVELFSRQQRPGWSCYGNELEHAHPEAA